MARFTLMQLLAFVFACCVYLAAVRSLAVALAGIETPLWRSVATHCGAWLVLSAIYLYWRLTGAMIIHAAIVVGLILRSIVLSGRILADSMEGIARDLASATEICTLGTLVSFPVAVLTLAIRGIKAKREAE